MNLIDFPNRFPDEESCKQFLKSLREEQGLKCSRCGHEEHYWKGDKQCWECKKCHRRTGLTSGTVMHATKLPLRYWFLCIHLLSSTAKSFSSCEIQGQLGHKYYEPVWAMCHKLKAAMGKRDDRYLLGGELEIDEGMFTSFCAGKQEGGGEDGEQGKRGRGSLSKTTVVVMAESKKVEGEVGKGRPDRKVGHVKMVAVPDATSGTLNETVGQRAENSSQAITDGHKGYINIEQEIEKVTQQTASGAEACKVLPWVHICISNAKRWFLAIHHAVSKKYIQNYLNEFVYNFNRRYMREVLFERLLIAGVAAKNTFKPDFR